jgi:hypothetical protein
VLRGRREFAAAVGRGAGGLSVSADRATRSQEIRPVFEIDDFGAELTPELREQELRQRELADRLANATRS